MITRIDKIDGHRVFRNFVWPATLADFGQCNLIYGWNGSGKTTLSNLLRCLELKRAITDGKVEFRIGNRVCSGANLATETGLPRIRVFNQDYRDDSVFATVQQLKPIFFLGKDSVEKQKKIEGLSAQRVAEQKKLDDSNSSKTKAAKSLDDFCIREAKAIKALLSSSGSNWYNNYDKACFRAACEKLLKLNALPARLTKNESDRFKKQKDETSKESISALTSPVTDFEKIKDNVETLLKQAVVSQVIDALTKDPSLAEWVLAGIGHHIGKEHSETCKFCNSPLSKERLEKLQAHFNDDYNQLLKAVEISATEIRQHLADFRELKLPPKSAFYDHLTQEFSEASGKFEKFREQVVNFLTELSTALDRKRRKPFESMTLSLLKSTLPGDGSSIVQAVNNVISRHNAETANFDKVVAQARTNLEQDAVLDALKDFTDKTKRVRDCEEAINASNATLRTLNEQIGTLEKDIVEHRKPAEELNAELRSYLGRDELTFSIQGNGYQITRNGVSASNLSEGERTAIALLYFLKSLQDKGFDISKDIVVIDDPVSSLDANSLFCAFGYIKDRTEKAGQLFVLTHNFPLFRQVKNWFNHLPHQRKADVSKRPARFYMVEAAISQGKRNACLKELDPLLHQFESEYHYLFKKVFDEANGTAVNRKLEDFYPMPNIARRMLEAFLSFRYPNEAGHLEQQIGLVNFDTAKKSRILRFLHTYSHDGKISEPEHDLSVLGETPEVLRNLLELVKAEDSKHYQEMEKMVIPKPTTV